MKISVDDQELFLLSEMQKRVIQNEISEEIFEDDMKRRLQYILMHKYEQCFNRLKKEWEPKLISRGLKAIPVDKDEFAALIFSQEDYKSSSQKLAKEQMEEDASFAVQ